MIVILPSHVPRYTYNNQLKSIKYLILFSFTYKVTKALAEYPHSIDTTRFNKKHKSSRFFFRVPLKISCRCQTT